MTKIAVLGGGSWGTGLSVALAHSRRSHEIALWARGPSIAAGIRNHRCNPRYLPEIEIPATITASSDLGEVRHQAYVIVCVVPSAHVREVFARAITHIAPEAILVSATKGLEPATHLRMTQVITQAGSQRFIPQVAVLSGPSFAMEAACGEPQSSTDSTQLADST